jgi:hypothetical protein
VSEELWDEYQPDDIMNAPAPEQIQRRRRRSAALKEKLAKTFAKIPHDRGLDFAKRSGNSALAVLLALDYVIFDEHSNRVKLTNNILKQYGITHQSKIRGLRQLAEADVIAVEWCGRGEAPIVTHRWYTADGKLNMVHAHQVT